MANEWQPIETAPSEVDRKVTIHRVRWRLDDPTDPTLKMEQEVVSGAFKRDGNWLHALGGSGSALILNSGWAVTHWRDDPEPPGEWRWLRR